MEEDGPRVTGRRYDLLWLLRGRSLHKQPEVLTHSNGVMTHSAFDAAHYQLWAPGIRESTTISVVSCTPTVSLKAIYQIFRGVIILILPQRSPCQRDGGQPIKALRFTTLGFYSWLSRLLSRGVLGPWSRRAFHLFDAGVTTTNQSVVHKRCLSHGSSTNSKTLTRRYDIVMVNIHMCEYIVNKKAWFTRT